MRILKLDGVDFPPGCGGDDPGLSCSHSNKDKQVLSTFHGDSTKFPEGSRVVSCGDGGKRAAMNPLHWEFWDGRLETRSVGSQRGSGQTILPHVFTEDGR